MIRKRLGMHAFSLIELLVVMAIATTMLAVLMPAVTAARRGARLTVCATNLSQIGAGIHTYAADMEGCIPFNGKPPVGINI